MLWSVFGPVTFEFVEGKKKKKETKAIQFTTAFFFLML